VTTVRTHAVAAAAYQVVVAHRTDSPKRRKKYGALAHKLPGLVLQNGLAQATGFLLAKGEAEHLALLDDLTSILRGTGTTGATDGGALHHEVIGADLAQTMTLTRRTLEATGWIKRYVQGVLGVDATGDSAGDEPAPSDVGVGG
jgi:CRISPR-associated protein Cmr5